MTLPVWILVLILVTGGLSSLLLTCAVWFGPRTVSCKLGLHVWWLTGVRVRTCDHCTKRQTLTFYSNRTHRWVTNP